MESLLTLFELKDCIVDEGADYDRLMERCFDWERIEQIRKEQLEVSVRYLKEIGGRG